MIGVSIDHGYCFFCVTLQAKCITNYNGPMLCVYVLYQRKQSFLFLRTRPWLSRENAWQHQSHSTWYVNYGVVKRLKQRLQAN